MPDPDKPISGGSARSFNVGIASVPLMIAGVVAPEVFHMTLQAKQLVFLGSMAIALFLVIIGVTKPTRRTLRTIAIVGMLACGLGFAGFATFYFWGPVAP